MNGNQLQELRQLQDIDSPNHQSTALSTNQDSYFQNKLKIYKEDKLKTANHCSFTDKNWIVAGIGLLLIVLILGLIFFNQKLIHLNTLTIIGDKQVVNGNKKLRKKTMFIQEITEVQDQQQIRPQGVTQISQMQNLKKFHNGVYQQVQQQYTPREQYEYDVEGKFSLWDLTPAQKKRLFRRYKVFHRNKLNKDEDYMEINYGKDEQFLYFARKFEENVEVINWHSIKFTRKDLKRIRFDFKIALHRRRKKIQKLLNKYSLEYNGKTGPINQKKNITYKRFLESLQYQRLTGQNFKKNPRLNKIYQQQKQYYQKSYQTRKINKELHSCIVIPTYNNVIDHRYLWNLESILQQDYSNYKLIIIDDASTDDTSQRIAQHLKWRGVDQSKAILLRIKNHQTALPNIYYGLHKYCDYNQIFYILDGDDEIIGTQVFKLFNKLYQQKKSYVLYASHFQYEIKNQAQSLGLGLPYAYSKQIKQQGTYRTSDHAYSQLRTVMSDLFLLINTKSLKDENGQFYWTISDNALYFSAMQMSCGRVDYIPQLQYWYNANTGINDWRTPHQTDYIRVKKHISFVQKHYQCIHKTVKKIKDSFNKFAKS